MLNGEKKAKVIALYLPQFHTIPENDEWWGKGFTEWTSVRNAIKYFPEHYQPRIPADLGYYDLRLPKVREAQAELAKEAGVDAFCYWHYWFGNGKQLLEKPLEEVVSSGKPDFPFCLGWGNHSWTRKNWNRAENRFSKALLIKQTYPGEEDIKKHFYKMMPVFQDKRYYKVHGKLLFYIFKVEDIPNFRNFINKWQKLALGSNLPGFFFIGSCCNPRLIDDGNYKLCDGVNLDLKNDAFFLKYPQLWNRLSYILPFPANIRQYSLAIEKMKNPLFKKDNVYPTILPNWDHSPRAGKSGRILHNSTPELFRKHITDIITLIKEKKEEDKIIFLKSWNEWGEGNYMEPDMRYGKRYIETLKECLSK